MSESVVAGVFGCDGCRLSVGLTRRKGQLCFVDKFGSVACVVVSRLSVEFQRQRACVCPMRVFFCRYVDFVTLGRQLATELRVSCSSRGMGAVYFVSCTQVQDRSGNGEARVSTRCVVLCQHKLPHCAVHMYQTSVVLCVLRHAGMPCTVRCASPSA